MKPHLLDRNTFGDTGAVSLHLIIYSYSDWLTEKRITNADAAAFHPRQHSQGCSLTVFLSQSTAQGSQELLHNHVDLGDEFLGVLYGKHHKDTMGEKLQAEKQILDPTVKKKACNGS